MAQINFDASNVPPADAFEPIPAGWYTMKITESEMKATKDQSGAYLALTFEVMEGPCKGRKVFTNLNLQNANPVAVEIAQKQLSAICHATGVVRVNDSVELHNIPLQVRVGIRQGQINPQTQQPYDPSNEVKGYKKLGGDAGAPTPGFTPAPTHTATPAPTPAPAGGSGTPPWAATPTPTPTPAPAPVAPAPAPAPVVAPPPAPVATPAPAPVPTPRINPPPPYQEGDVVNGHQLKNNTWVPYTPPAAPPAPPVPVAAPPAPPTPPAPPAGVPEGGSSTPPWAKPAGS